MDAEDPRAALLAALTAERFNGGGWKRHPDRPGRSKQLTWDDSEVTCARRRRELAEAWNEERNTG